MGNIYRLGVKELWSLARDPTMLVLIAFAFSFAVYSAGVSMPETLNRAAIAIVDEDHSPLSARIGAAFYPPEFSPPQFIDSHAVDAGLDAGRYTFVLVIPPNFQRDVLSQRAPQMQLNIDATRMSQAFAGDGAIQAIALGEVRDFLARSRTASIPPVELAWRARFNPTLSLAWFGSLMELVNQITMVSVILTGAALIREREHGTVEHLLVMPVSPTEIMLAKVWAMGLVVMAATSLSLGLVIRGLLAVPIEGSLVLFMVCVALHLFATTSLGVFMATLARSMPQFGLLLMLTMMPLQMLSGGLTPREAMPVLIYRLMAISPTTHFTEASQAILYRAAGLEVVWPSFAALAVIGVVLFGVSLARFRRTLSSMV